MIKTFLTSNTIAMKTGGVEIQSSKPVASMTGLGTSTSNTTLPLHQQPIPNLTNGAFFNGSVKINNLPSLSTMSKTLGAAGTLISTVRGGVSSISPNFHSNFDPGRNLPKSSDEMAVTTKKFEPYEHLTGISQERPEVIMLTNFLPLYEPQSSSDHEGKYRYSQRPNNNPLTPAGEFFDIQSDIRTLRTHNTKQMLTTLKIQYHTIRQTISDRNDSFKRSMEELNQLSYYLWTVMSTLEKLKKQLDIRDSLHTVDPHEILRRQITNFSPTRSMGILKHLTTSVNTFFKPSYDISYVLSLFGYTDENVKNTYSSTKIWLQMLLELKYVLRSHSLNLLNVDQHQQRKDTSPINITKSTIRRFEYTSFLPTLPNLDEVKATLPKTIPDVLSAIMTSYGKIYESVNFKNEEQRLAGLINMISREYRYSRGLADNDVTRTLNSYYGYSTETLNNLSVFDSIIGQFGNNISDIDTIQSNTLVSLAQRQPAENVAVLPFESRYIEGDTGVLTPGSSYYVDPVLLTKGKEYDVSRLKQFQDSLTQAHKQFSVVVNGMNLLSSEYVDQYNNKAGEFETALNNPRALFEEIRKNLMSSDNVCLLPTIWSDPLTPVLAEASINTKLKSLLMMYFVTKISRAYTQNISFFSASLSQDNTPTTDELVEQIIAELLKKQHASTTATLAAKTSKFTSGPKSQPVTANTHSFINIDSIKNTLKHGGKLITVIEHILGKILAAFKADGKALNGSSTRYGGHLDTVIMMTIFDVIIGILKNYGNRRIAGQHVDRSLTQLVINDRYIKHSQAILDIDEKLAREVTLAQHAIFIVLNTLDKLSNSIGNVINYLNGPNSISELQKVSSLFDNTDLIQMLFSEQQIRLFAAAIADITSAFQNHTSSGITPGDVDGDGDFDSDDEIQVLDDADINSRMKASIRDIFSLPEYTQKGAASRKILTVGIPLGFSRHLQQKVDIKKLKKASFDTRQNDVINIAVHKVDLQNPDIVYKPQRFMFELSRFPVRNESFFKETSGNKFIDFINRFPTRDSSQVFNESGTQVQYFRSNEGLNQAMIGDDYSFISSEQKQKLYTNHVMSHLLETYLKVMTGMSTADYHFDMVEPPPHVESDFVDLILNHQINRTVSIQRFSTLSNAELPHGGLFFAGTNAKSKGSAKSSDTSGGSRRALANSTGNSGISTTNALSNFSSHNPVTVSGEQTSLDSTDGALSKLTRHHVGPAVHMMGVINEFSRMTTPLSNPLAISKRLIHPKQFDRVFNVLIDPFQFEIDIEKTNLSPHGKQALELLIKKGDIEPTKSPTTLNMSKINTTQTHIPRRHNLAEGDMLFEKYIVSIETIGEEEI